MPINTQSPQLSPTDIIVLRSALVSTNYETRIDAIVSRINSKDDPSEIVAIQVFLQSSAASYLELTQKRMVIVNLVQLILAKK